MLQLDAIANVASADLIENGILVQLVSPGTMDAGGQQPLYLDKEQKLPCRVKVRSTRCAAFQTLYEQTQRQGNNTARQTKGDAAKRELVVAQVFKAGRRRQFALLTVGFENVAKDVQGYQPASEEELLAIYDKPEYQWLVDFVFSVAGDEARFGAVPEGNVDGADQKA